MNLLFDINNDIKDSKLSWDITLKILFSYLIYKEIEKQPPRGVLRKRCSENMQQIYRRTPMPKSDFNKVAKQLY